MSDEPNLLDRSVDELEVSVRTSMALQNAGINTIGELVARTRVELIRFGKFSNASINELTELLGEMGLSLRDS